MRVCGLAMRCLRHGPLFRVLLQPHALIGCLGPVDCVPTGPHAFRASATQWHEGCLGRLRESIVKTFALIVGLLALTKLVKRAKSRPEASTACRTSCNAKRVLGTPGTCAQTGDTPDCAVFASDNDSRGAVGTTAALSLKGDMKLISDEDQEPAGKIRAEANACVCPDSPRSTCLTQSTRSWQQFDLVGEGCTLSACWSDWRSKTKMTRKRNARMQGDSSSDVWSCVPPSGGMESAGYDQENWSNVTKCHNESTVVAHRNSCETTENDARMLRGTHADQCSQPEQVEGQKLKDFNNAQLGDAQSDKCDSAMGGRLDFRVLPENDARTPLSVHVERGDRWPPAGEQELGDSGHCTLSNVTECHNGDTEVATQISWNSSANGARTCTARHSD